MTSIQIHAVAFKINRQIPFELEAEIFITYYIILSPFPILFIGWLASVTGLY